MSRITFALLLWLVACSALAFRLPRLADRPMHADEAVQAAIFRGLLLHGRYRYDPHEFHGPTLSYATLPSARLSSANRFADTTAVTYRIVPVIFGVCLIFLLGWLGDALGKPAVIVAGILAAISPAMVYYSRYYIHETLLVFFSLAAFAAGWRYARSQRLSWCIAAGVFVGLMQATKETAALAYLAALAASGLTVLWAWFWDRDHLLLRETSGSAEADGSPSSDPSRLAAPPWRAALPPARHGVWLGAAAVLTAALWLSSFGTNPQGLVDGVLTYLPWLGRAAGDSPHVHPWYFYGHRLGWWRLGDGPRWSEGLILMLAAAGALFALAGRHGGLPGTQRTVVRWLAFYTVVLASGYSVIPYKTPWCLLQFLIGLILLAGVGAVALVRVTPTLPLKAVLILVLTGLGGQLGWQSYRAAFVLPADPRNPWVYAHTLPDIERLEATVEELVAATPAGRATPVKVVWNGAYYWPLPWYLRRLERVELWTKVPEDAQAPIVIASAAHDAALTEQLDDTHLMTGYYGVRPNVLAQLWVRMDVWEAHLRRLGRL